MTAALAGDPAAPRRIAGERLRAASLALLAGLPLAMAVAHRSSPLVLTLAAALALAGAIADRDAGLLDRIRAMLVGAVGRAALAFLAWCALSLLWSPEPGRSAYALGELVLPMGAALVLAAALPGRAPPRWAWALAAVMAVAALSIVAELQTGMALRRAMGMRWNSFVLNRPTLTLVLLAAPVLGFLLGRRGTMPLLAAAALAGLTALAVATSESGAAVLGLVAGLGAGAFARLAPPRLSAGLGGLGIVLALALAPVAGSLAERLIPPRAHETMAASHSRDRVDIWKSFGAAIRETPLLGSGFAASHRLDRAPVASRVPPESRTLLAVGHPHNAAVQVWAELGAVGAALAGIALLLALRALARFSAPALAPRLALFATAAAVSLVGHGAWQGWWAAGIGAAIVWFRLLQPREHAP